VDVRSFSNHTKIWDFNPCGYAFVVEKDEFNFSSNYLHDLLNERVPLMFDWDVGNNTCKETRNKSNFACQDKNSECFDPQNRQGYRCMCKQGFKGNPYLDGGCQGMYILYIHLQSIIPNRIYIVILISDSTCGLICRHRRM
jgi:hypothetical protein